MTYPVSLAASWQLAFDRLAVDEPAALDLLTLAAHFAPEPIPLTRFTAHPDQLPESLAAAVSDPLAFAGLPRLLRRRALARISPDSLQPHRLVQAILRSRPGSTTGHDKMSTAAISLLRTARPDNQWNNPVSWPVWWQLLSSRVGSRQVSQPSSATPSPWHFPDNGPVRLIRGDVGPLLPYATAGRHNHIQFSRYAHNANARNYFGSPKNSSHKFYGDLTLAKHTRDAPNVARSRRARGSSVVDHRGNLHDLSKRLACKQHSLGRGSMGQLIGVSDLRHHSLVIFKCPIFPALPERLIERIAQ